MKEIYGGFDNVDATADDCKNFRRDMNKFIGERDAQMVVEKLITKRDFIPGFTMDYMTDSENKLTGLFWSDEESKRNYFTFGDIVSFDATFHSNRYKMVFVPFTGIDNHNRCVTFAVGLLAKETIESYKWLLDSYLKASGHPPKIVVTDQCPAMKQAIEDVFPNTRHRLCMWHIMQKLSTKVGTHLASDETFRKRICNIVWTDKIDPEDFESEWNSIMHDYNIENKWLDDMYDMRAQWIPAYYRDESMSGLMRTTSRSESENHFFCQLTNTSLSLVEFLSHFETAMDVQRYNHSKNYHQSRYTTPHMKTSLKIEKEAAEIYTRSIFFDVQDEIYHAVMHCHSFNVTDIDAGKLVEIQDGVYTNKGNNPHMYMLQTIRVLWIVVPSHIFGIENVQCTFISQKVCFKTLDEGSTAPKI